MTDWVQMVENREAEIVRLRSELRAAGRCLTRLSDKLGDAEAILDRVQAVVDSDSDWSASELKQRVRARLNGETDG